ncbi:hypothetical protein OG455_28020 [Kitasatospora sp. NBC_01287]|uniref:hypothetical protein n=1 Tax=Kitasatospora sp. NBC_01287 TaxID=2903573 RepID=UPI00225649A9|nr:hypothetical protein [Kitasatospora sp. NBC_01287]MCX4749309.1 hypothetical protein [Kitasatospora sp. NBC_01287]
MHDEILSRARWLLREVHLTPTEAAVRLLDYFPDLEREERARYLREAAERPLDHPPDRPMSRPVSRPVNRPVNRSPDRALNQPLDRPGRAVGSPAP